MNDPAANPFSGLKAILARIMSGGLMGLLLNLVFYRRLSAGLAALEDLFAQWKAGTLPLPVLPARAPAQVAAPRPQSAVHRPARPRRLSVPRRATIRRRRPMTRTRAVSPVVFRRPTAAPLPRPSAPAPIPRRARCTKGCNPKPHKHA